MYTTFSVQALDGSTTPGIDNWIRVSTDYRLPIAAKNVGSFLALWLPLLVLVVLTLALLVHGRRNRFGSAMRFVYYVPGAVTGSAAALLWIFMVSPTVSPFGPILSLFGITNAGQMISSSMMPVLVTLMAISAGAGGWIVILYGALLGIPDEIIEAARIDGASAWQLAWHVKLPLVRKYVAFIVITSFAGGAQLFAEPQLLGIISPGTLPAAWSVNQLAFYYASAEANFGRASVLSMMLLAVGLAGALLLIYRTKFYETDARD
jgi:multiple sugar transport system permease protein